MATIERVKTKLGKKTIIKTPIRYAYFLAAPNPGHRAPGPAPGPRAQAKEPVPPTPPPPASSAPPHPHPVDQQVGQEG